jgi:hypothetical protein
VLWQREEIARRSVAAAWFAYRQRFDAVGGVDEVAAARAQEVILVGAPDFFPSKPLPAGVKVWRVSPLPGTDPDDLEGIMLRLFAGLAFPVEEHDERAVVPCPAPAEAQVVADQGAAVASAALAEATVAQVAAAVEPGEQASAQAAGAGVVEAEQTAAVADTAVPGAAVAAVAGTAETPTAQTAVDGVV